MYINIYLSRQQMLVSGALAIISLEGPLVPYIGAICYENHSEHRVIFFSLEFSATFESYTMRMN